MNEMTKWMNRNEHYDTNEKDNRMMHIRNVEQ